VIAQWHDQASGERKDVVAGEQDGAKRLRSVYADQQQAWDAANSELARIHRGTAELVYTLAEGRADLTPETPLTVTGLKPSIDGADWIVTECRRRVDDGGFTTEILAEKSG
jgi:phage protein D